MNTDTDIKNLRAIPQFVGMTDEEISNWIAINNAREHQQWEKDFQAKLEEQRAKDLDAIKEKKHLDLNPRPIVIEDCIKIDLGGEKCLYLNRTKMRQVLSARRNQWTSQY